MPLQLITAPYAEPLHLADATSHLKQYAGVDDAHILATVIAARKTAESKTWRQLVAARYKQVLDSFPGIGLFGVPWGKVYTMPRNAICLERCPLLTVESITYLDMAGVRQTVADTLYTVDYSSEPARITPKFGQIWPIPLPQIGAVEVTFTAGFADAITVDTTANTITTKLWKALAAGDVVRFSNSGGILPAPLVINTDYYAVAASVAGVFQVALTSGGAAIDLTTTGTGTSFIGEIPGDILGWIRVRVGSMDQYREEETVVAHGQLHDLAYVDGLLDSYPTWW